MFFSTFTRRVLFNASFLFIFFLAYFLIFSPIYKADTVIIEFAKTPFNICEKYPAIWQKLKLTFILVSSFSSFIIINLIYSSLFTKKKREKTKLQISKDDLHLFIANDSSGNPINLPAASLYQNILITGTIGSRQNKLCNVSFYKTTYKI